MVAIVARPPLSDGQGLATYIICNDAESSSLRAAVCNGPPHPQPKKVFLSAMSRLAQDYMRMK